MKRITGPALFVFLLAAGFIAVFALILTVSIQHFIKGNPGDGWGALIAAATAAISAGVFVALGVDELKIKSRKKPRRDTDGEYFTRMSSFERGAGDGIEAFIESFRDEYGNLNMYKKVIRIDGKRTYTDYLSYHEIRMIDRQADAVDEASHQESKRLREGA